MKFSIILGSILAVTAVVVAASPTENPETVYAGSGLPGDANCDGVVNSIDAAFVLQFSAGLLPTLPCPDNADANGDGQVNSLDAALILQFAAGLLSTLGPSQPPTDTPGSISTLVPPATSTPIEANETPTPGGSQPQNDNFGNAAAIEALPFNTSQSTEGATTEPSEQLDPEGCLIFNPDFIGGTVWYSFTANATTTVRASTSGSDFDTVLVLYSGSDLPSLISVACSDDDGEGVQSELEAEVVEGTTYHIQASGFSGVTGHLVLKVVELEPIPTPAEATPEVSCHPSYVGVCLDPDAEDYDCAGGSGNGPLYVEGPFDVVGDDKFGLDTHDNGFGCQN